MEKKDDDILNQYFKKPLHDIQKIYKLAEKLGWKLERQNTHKIYKREYDTLALSCSPKIGVHNYYYLRDKEIERILS